MKHDETRSTRGPSLGLLGAKAYDGAVVGQAIPRRQARVHVDVVGHDERSGAADVAALVRVDALVAVADDGRRPAMQIPQHDGQRQQLAQSVEEDDGDAITAVSFSQ